MKPPTRSNLFVAISNRFLVWINITNRHCREYPFLEVQLYLYIYIVLVVLLNKNNDLPYHNTSANCSNQQPKADTDTSLSSSCLENTLEDS